jgi:cystathionine beta-lyase/cystathionine gamma-synthase
MATDSPMGPHTAAIHAGQEPDPTTGAVMQPVYFTSTYRQPGVGTGWPYDYARTINPTRRAGAGALEGGLDARCFASGMSAIQAVLLLLQSGDHLVVSRNVYGGTYRLFEGVYRKFGLDFSWVDTTDMEAVRAAWKKTTRFLYVETPANPTLSVTDLRACARLAHARGARLVVDNTFLSRCCRCRWRWRDPDPPTTKYLNGHTRSGAVSPRTEDAETLATSSNGRSPHGQLLRAARPEEWRHEAGRSPPLRPAPQGGRSTRPCAPTRSTRWPAASRAAGGGRQFGTWPRPPSPACAQHAGGEPPAETDPIPSHPRLPLRSESAWRAPDLVRISVGPRTEDLQADLPALKSI